MPNIFDGYCYASITEAANAEISSPIFNASSGLVDYVSFSPTTATLGNMAFNYKTMANSVPVVYTIPRTYPACSNVGYQHNFTGLTLDDVSITSMLVVAVWAAVWSIKALRRGL